MKPICVKCSLFYRSKKNGISFIEGMPVKGSNWQPYKLWMGDLWECLGCGHELIVGVGQNPISEHYRPDFQRWIKHYNPKITINDC